MASQGMITRKRFGQHWLKDVSVLNKIVDAADLVENDRILEIGPGRGALTEKLLQSRAGLVHGIELDFDLVAGLKRRFSDQPRFTLQEGDALSIPLMLPDGKPANKVVANIPYNITGPLLSRLVGRLGRRVETSYQRLVLLLQKEVAQRILSLPGQSSCSALSIRLQLLAKCRKVCEVPPGSFSPPPKVYSQVIVLDPLRETERLDFELESKVDSLVRTAFLSRRKKLRNTLITLCPLNELEVLAKEKGVSLDQRPQELSPAIWIELAKGLRKIQFLKRNEN